MKTDKHEPTKIEKNAIHFLETPIVECEYLDSSINSMDKELSWDGYIYTYHDKVFSNKSLDDKIPIQVKGHRDDKHQEINREKIQYPVKLETLQNYYNDRGVLYFRILLSDTKKEIFYNILYPSKIKSYLDKASRKKNKRQINITLTKLKPTPTEMLRICRQFTCESLKQGPGRGQIVPKSVCISELKNYNKLQATAIDTRSPFEFLKRLSTGDVCFYASEEKTNIWFPVLMDKGVKCFVGHWVEQEIMVGGKIFYSKYEIIGGTDKSLCIRVSENLTINWVRGTFDFKKNTCIDELYNDAIFLNEMIRNKEFFVGGVSIKYSSLRLKESMRNDLDFIVDFYSICNSANMQIPIPLKDFNESDIRNACRLVNIFREKVEIKKDNIYTFNLKIAERIYPFIIYRDEQNNIQFANRIYESKYQGYVMVNDNHYKVPMFCDLKSDVFSHLYKFDYDDLIHQVDNTEFNIFTLETMNYAVIELICAYDISGEAKLLDVAEYILKKMYLVDDSLIYAQMNEWQILKRKDRLMDVDKNKMRKLLDEYEEDNQVLCGLYALLDDKKTATEYLNKLSQGDREVFTTFPIYKYVVEDK